MTALPLTLTPLDLLALALLCLSWLGVTRVIEGFRIVPYNIPEGCIGAYFPEANPLVPLAHHDKQAHTPAYKAVPVRLSRSAMQTRTEAA